MDNLDIEKEIKKNKAFLECDISKQIMLNNMNVALLMKASLDNDSSLDDITVIHELVIDMNNDIFHYINNINRFNTKINKKRKEME